MLLFFFCFFGIGGAAVFTVVVVVVTHPQPLQHPGDIVPCSPSSSGSALLQCCSLMACGFSVRNISQRGFGFDGGDESVSPGSCRLEKSWGKKKKKGGGVDGEGDCSLQMYKEGKLYSYGSLVT